MELTLILLAAMCLVVLVLVGWVLTLLSLPGNWLIVASTALYALLIPNTSTWDISWTLVTVLAVLAGLGEIIELIAAAAGVQRLGGSRRSALLSGVGSIIGALLGTAWIPVPIVGTLLGACLGALGGAMLGESWKGRASGHNWQVGLAAFWGRLLGSMAKILIASVLVTVTLAGLLIH